ncbi:MAG TPA: hypothetical protein PLO39_07980 [Saprospiraceae bacterium]|jgi:hypothetical protein|nr:hypothetical protein [Saprospiraceae bacterium]
MNYVWIITVMLFFELTHLVAEKIGSYRKVGYGKTVLWSLMLTPIIAFFIAISSPKINDR